jgi:CubicO group peptidase (beta-lactamase class C family)
MAVVLASALPLKAQVASSGAWQQYAIAEDAGFTASALERARHYADSVKSGAVMAVYRGRVLAAWGDVARELELHSVRKSLVSALYGAGVAEGRIDLDRTLGELGIEDRVPLSEQERRARLRDIIAARSGVYLPAAYADAEQDRERPARGSHAPGTHFFYNNWDYNVAGVIYEKLMDEDLYEGFQRRIAQPLGMEDFAPSDGFLVYEPSQSDHPAHTFRMSTRDLARFGQLYLQRGKWEGRTVLPAEWIAESTRPKSDFGNGTGYAWMWWTYAAGSLGPRYPNLNQHDVFSASGTGGQFVLVVPAAELVVVHRGDTDNGRQVSGRDAWTIAELILSARAGQPAASPRIGPLDPVALATQAPAKPRPTVLEIDRALMSEYAGEYEVGPQTMARVFIHNGHLFMNFPGRGEAELLALTTSEFTIAPVAGVHIRFERNAEGRVTHFDATIGPQRLRGTRR